jgi:hypothetical protein
MNDNELITAVRESFTDVHSTTPAAQIVTRGRTVRTRRRIPVVTGALAVAAGAALALTTLLPASQAAPTTAQLTAWTVVKQADGSVYVTIREMRDPAGLQATLRADGVPAYVGFPGHPLPKYCHRERASLAQMKSVFHFIPGASQANPADRHAIMVIHPSALPTGTGVSIGDGLASGPDGTTVWGLMHASQQCTGSS